jgi:hypothetical protein
MSRFGDTKSTPAKANEKRSLCQTRMIERRIVMQVRGVKTEETMR